MAKQRGLSQKEREYIFLRDKGKCCDCGKLCGGGWIYYKGGRIKTFQLNATHEIHHIIPLDKGGECIMSNLILLCMSCHYKRHSVKYYGGL
jgi:5-methylcytosine-specific restriction endonuclease McrA